MLRSDYQDSKCSFQKDKLSEFKEKLLVVLASQLFNFFPRLELTCFFDSVICRPLGGYIVNNWGPDGRLEQLHGHFPVKGEAHPASLVLFMCLFAPEGNPSELEPL